MAEVRLPALSYNGDGLVCAIAVDAATNEVLMQAWMNEEAFRLCLETGEAHYWSRSRRSLWHKGATSGAIQTIREIRVDCDADAVLLRVEQRGGGACHTGRKSCFFRTVAPDGALRDIPDHPA